MADRPIVTFLVLLTTVVQTLLARLQQKTSIQGELQGMMLPGLRDGLFDLARREGVSLHSKRCSPPMTSSPSKIRGMRSIQAGTSFAPRSSDASGGVR